MFSIKLYRVQKIIGLKAPYTKLKGCHHKEITNRGIPKLCIQLLPNYTTITHYPMYIPMMDLSTGNQRHAVRIWHCHSPISLWIMFINQIFPEASKISTKSWSCWCAGVLRAVRTYQNVVRGRKCTTSLLGAFLFIMGKCYVPICSQCKKKKMLFSFYIVTILFIHVKR